MRAYPVALVAGVLILVLAGVIFFRSSTLVSLNDELEQLDREWARMNTNLRRAPNLEADLASILTLKNSVRERVLDPDQRAINYDYFYSMERDSGVRVVTLNQSGVIETKGSSIAGITEFKKYRLVGYTISIEGEFDKIVKFLTALSNGHHLIRVSSFNVSRTQGAALSVNLQLQILGTPYES